MKKNQIKEIGALVVIIQIILGIIVFQSADEQYNSLLKAEEIINTQITSQAYVMSANVNISANIFSGINAILTNMTTNETQKEIINDAYNEVINKTYFRLNTSNQVLKETRALVSAWYLRYNNSIKWDYYFYVGNAIVVVLVMIMSFSSPPDDSTCVFKDRKRKIINIRNIKKFK